MNNVTAKIGLSPQTEVKKKKKKKTSSAAIGFFYFSPPFFLLALSIFPFLRSFLGGFSGSFCLRLLVFFSVKRMQFSFGTFSKIQQDNALAFTITYALIFVNAPSSSNIPVSLF